MAQNKNTKAALCFDFAYFLEDGGEKFPVMLSETKINSLQKDLEEGNKIAILFDNTTITPNGIKSAFLTASLPLDQIDEILFLPNCLQNITINLLVILNKWFDINVKMRYLNASKIALLNASSSAVLRNPLGKTANP